MSRSLKERIVDYDIQYLNHNVRRPLTNLISLCDLLCSENNTDSEYDHLLSQFIVSFEEFEKAIKKYPI